jgi:membrane protease subunit HflK
VKPLRWLLLVGALAYVGSGLYFVQPDEHAVVRRFGAVLSPPKSPGPHFGLPWGLDRVDRVKVREVKRVAIGPLPVAEDPVGANPLQCLTGDRNLVNVRATVHYTIQQPAFYLFQTADVGAMLATAGQAVLSEILAGRPVDWVLTTGKREMAVLLMQELQRIGDRYRLGIVVRSVDFSSVAPPGEVAEAFAKVISALREREQAIHQAQSFANKTLAQAQADAQQKIDQGRGERDRAIRQAQGEAERFSSLLAEYQKASALVATRLYLETMAEILPRLRSKMIVDSGSNIDLSILREEPR